MFVTPPSDTPETEKIYASSAAAQGFVMNLTKVWAWRPDVFEGFAALRNQLTRTSTLSQRDLAVMVCAAAAQLGDSYCALAWGRMLAQEVGPAAAAAVLVGWPAAPQPELTARDRALAVWARLVVSNPNGAQASDLQAMRAAGLGERELVEATIFIAFRLAFSTVNDALGVCPDPQLADAVPAAVRAAVSFGRPTGSPPASDAQSLRGQPSDVCPPPSGLQQGSGDGSDRQLQGGEIRTADAS